MKKDEKKISTKKSNNYYSNHFNMFLIIVYAVYTLAFIVSGVCGFFRYAKLEPIVFEGDNTVIQILLNNFEVELSLLVLGAVTLGIYSFLVTILNGFILGFSISNIPSGKAIEVLIKHLLPHFVFETTSFFLASTIGLAGIVTLLVYILTDQSVSRNCMLKIRNIIVLSVILLIVAAVIEGSISK